MTSSEDREIRRALGPESKATFRDLVRRMDADRPGMCDSLAADVTALATGSHDDRADAHLSECAACRDRADSIQDVWHAISWPASKARFDPLRPHLSAAPPFRFGRLVAAAALGAAAVLSWALPSGPSEYGGQGLADRLNRDGISLRHLADLGTARAASTLAAIGGPDAEALLLGMMGRNPEVDAVATKALTGKNLGPMHPAELVRIWRPDLLTALMDAALPGSASTIAPALYDPRLAWRATLALERLPRAEVESALAFEGLGASPEEAAELAERGIAVTGALAAASRSPSHRTKCFWSAVAGADLDFLFAAAGSPLLREDAFRFLDLLPEELVAAECRKALVDSNLAAGAARAAGRLRDRSLVPALMKAASQPPQGMGAVDLVIEEGPLVSARGVTLASLCMEAVTRLNAD